MVFAFCTNPKPHPVIVLKKNEEKKKKKKSENKKKKKKKNRLSFEHCTMQKQGAAMPVQQ